MRLVIVGGSAHSTPQLFDGGLSSREREPVDVTLAARSKVHREAVARAIGFVAPDTKVSCTGLEGDEFSMALAAADAIVVQVRVGGYAARTYDERFPLEHGICGDEGLGPGGLAAAWRTWPVLDALLASIVASGSKARVILLTSPIGVLTRAALDAYPQLQLVGICELPFVTLSEVAAATGASLDEVDFAYAGVNHLGWFTSIETGGRDLLDEYTQNAAERPFPSGSWLREHRVLPLKYLRLHYDRSHVVREQRASRPRGEALGELQQRAFAAYLEGDRTAIENALAQRSAPWYTHAVAPYLRGLAGDEIDTILFLTGRNDGYLPWFDADEVVEIPHRFVHGRLERTGSPARMPANVKALLDTLVAYERRAAAAVRARDAAGIEAALAAHPWVEASSGARTLAAAVTSPDLNTFR
jgi:6-phospho-beta-glucosidase